jgi:hypothetical protein
MVFAIGCSTQETNRPIRSGSTETAAPSKAVDGDLSGLWVGTTSTGGLMGMAGLTRSFKFNLHQEADKLTGSYVCYNGKTSNAICHNPKGTIEGTARGTHIALNILMLPDASNCKYTGTLDYNGNGQYACYSQGQIVEQGTWQASRPSPHSAQSLTHSVQISNNRHVHEIS